ncbi:hypothetical protein ABEB36_010413 [Hypothenemus hampei]|uniref:Uncharacterized protein n=1 Tax=Hypothenemus hampei TaxID=57062 RepID=A0ABD1EK56_HYPHA
MIPSFRPRQFGKQCVKHSVEYMYNVVVIEVKVLKNIFDKFGFKPKSCSENRKMVRKFFQFGLNIFQYRRIWTIQNSQVQKNFFDIDRDQNSPLKMTLIL